MPRLLILEDDDNLRETLVDIFEDGGYEVSGASGSQEALALASSKVFEVMISDIRMAGPDDGIATVKKIKEGYLPNLIVLMMTGYADSEAPGRALGVDVDDYIMKSDFHKASALLEKVDRLLQYREKNKKGIFGMIFAPLVARPLALVKQLEKKSLEHKEEKERQMLARAHEIVKEEKLKAYRHFVVGVSSKTLFASAAVEIWYTLADVEKKALQAQNLDQLRYLRDQYLAVQQHIVKFVAKPGNLKPAPADGANARQVRDLLEKVRTAKLSADELQHAESVRLMPESMRKQHQEFDALYRAAWAS